MTVSEQATEVADRKHAFLAQGWNTWDTRSVLRHVLLPEGLALTLGFAAYDKLVWLDQAFFGRREMGRTPGTILTSTDKKLPIDDAIEIKPGIRSYDGSYIELELSLRGARYRVETAAKGSDWAALITPLGSDPWPRVLTVHTGFLWNRPGVAHRDGSSRLVASLPDREISVYVDGEVFCDPNLPAISPYLSVKLNRSVAVSAGEKRGVEEVKGLLQAARKQVVASHAAYGELSEAHEAMQSSLAWNVIYEPKYGRVLCTVARDWNCIRGGYAVFCWDSFFTAWMIAIDNPSLGYACMLETFREMVDDSFVSNVVQGTGRRALDRSQPPVASVCVLGMYRSCPDKQSLLAAWPALLAWNRWWQSARRNAEGSLSLGSNPFAPVVGDPAEFVQPNTLAGAMLEALDNAPMYEGATFDTDTHLMSVEDVGLNSLYVADCEALAEIGAILGYETESIELEERARHYGGKLQSLWSEADGTYLNRHVDTRESSKRQAPTSFYPLLAGTASREQAERLVEGHLLNPEAYGGEWMIPSVPRYDPAFPDQLYMRGSIWPPINFLVYLGLKRYGQDAAIKEVVGKSLDLLLTNWRSKRVVPENFSAIDGSGGTEKHSHPLLTWGGLCGFMAMIEKGQVPMPLPPVGCSDELPKQLS